MSEFFKPVEYELLKSPADQAPKIRVLWHREKLQSALEEIDEEIVRIKNGTSDFTTYAVNPGKHGFPARNVLVGFVADPADKALPDLRQICRQDFGARAGELFVKLILEAREEVLND